MQKTSPRFNLLYTGVLYFHTFLVKIHGHRGGQGMLGMGRGKRTWAPGPGPGAHVRLSLTPCLGPLGRPVAMYFHKKGMDISYFINNIYGS